MQIQHGLYQNGLKVLAKVAEILEKSALVANHGSKYEGRHTFI